MVCFFGNAQPISSVDISGSKSEGFRAFDETETQAWKTKQRRNQVKVGDVGACHD
jgi:hypothetical protein